MLRFIGIRVLAAIYQFDSLLAIQPFSVESLENEPDTIAKKRQLRSINNRALCPLFASPKVKVAPVLLG